MSIQSFIRNRCQKWPCILSRANHPENKQWNSMHWNGIPNYVQKFLLYECLPLFKVWRDIAQAYHGTYLKVDSLLPSIGAGLLFCSRLLTQFYVFVLRERSNSKNDDYAFTLFDLCCWCRVSFLILISVCLKSLWYYFCSNFHQDEFWLVHIS